MLKLLLILMLLPFKLFAQDLSRDLEFIETQNTQAVAFKVPVYMDLAGNISLAFRDKLADVSVLPMAHGAWRTHNSVYIKPVQSSAFSFLEQKSNLGWIQVKRKRWEVGVGLGAIIQNYVGIGLTPYKGARMVKISHVDDPEEKTPAPKLPKSLDEMHEWQIGDQGSYQTYGGVDVSVGINYSFVNIVNVGMTVQNLFSVMINKVAPNRIVLSIGEENLNKRRIQTGAFMAKAQVNFFNGKRLTTHFSLNLDDPLHHDLYKLAIKGKLSALQEKLPQEAQMMKWKGSERVGYIGIPGVAGKHFTRSELEMTYEDETEVMDIRSGRNSGILIPLRNHSKIVYQTEEAIILFWFSEMNKADEKLLDKRFLTPGRIMGAKGFENVLPRGTKIGATLSQMGMSFTREELENVTPTMLEEVLDNFKNRCEDLKLDCAKTRKFNKIAKTLRGYLDKKWEQVRDKLGFLMLDEPALIHSYVKTIKAQKKVYFKFMNQKYQSMEGAAPIVF